jgi:hypothetical protein
MSVFQEGLPGILQGDVPTGCIGDERRDRHSPAMDSTRVLPAVPSAAIVPVYIITPPNMAHPHRQSVPGTVVDREVDPSQGLIEASFG